MEIRQIAPTHLAAGFAKIRLIYGGVCNTDLELQRGYYGFRGIPGHEFVGEVVEAGNRQLIGKRVVGEINLACQQCDLCRRALQRHCPQRMVLGIVRHPGAFQEFLMLPESNLYVVPVNVSSEDAVFTEPLAAACEILDQVPFPCNSEIAVLGDGKLGLLIALVLRAHGHRVIQFGRHRNKLSIAERAGVAVEVAGEVYPRAAFQWVVEATGSQEGLIRATKMAKPRGTVIMKSTVHGEVGIDTAGIIVNELTLIGSRCGRFEPALELLRLGSVPVSELLSEMLPLLRAPEAFALAAQRGVLKVLLAG